MCSNESAVTNYYNTCNVLRTRYNIVTACSNTVIIIRVYIIIVLFYWNANEVSIFAGFCWKSQGWFIIVTSKRKLIRKRIYSFKGGWTWQVFGGSRKERGWQTARCHLACGRPGAQHVLLYLLSHTQLQVKAIHNLKLHLGVEQYTYSSLVHTYLFLHHCLHTASRMFSDTSFLLHVCNLFVHNSQLLTEEDVVDLAWACFIIIVINMARLPSKMR